jgi:regulator of protease activity HflC (stomatin/prohibitin superfamily)
VAIYLALGAFLMVLAASIIRVLPEGQRLAILRLGRFVGSRGPGIVMILPFVDRTIRIDLDGDIPNWRSLPSEALDQEIERRTTSLGSGYR